MDSKQYLERSLEEIKGITDSTEQKNKMRRQFKHFFKERDCMVLGKPVENQFDLGWLADLHESKLSKGFVE